MFVYGDIFFRIIVQWKLRIGVAQIQFRELSPSCQIFEEVIQRRNWILLQMGDSVHRQFVVSANSNLPVSFENWHYRVGQLEWRTGSITFVCTNLSSSSSIFLFSAYGTDLGLEKTGWLVAHDINISSGSLQHTQSFPENVCVFLQHS